MKTLLFHRQAADTVGDMPAVTVVPDSAIVPPGRPVFVPGEPAQWSVSLRPAFRIGRLGKNIAERFACRYVDAAAPMAVMVPCGVDDDGCRAMLACIDGAVTHGTWTPLDETAASALTDAPITLTMNGLSMTFTPEEVALRAAIHAVSHFTTLKTGDIIVPLDTQLTIPAQINVTVDAIMDPVGTLKYRIK